MRLQFKENNNITNLDGDPLNLTDTNIAEQQRDFTIPRRLALNYIRKNTTQCYNGIANPTPEQLVERRTATWNVQFSEPIANPENLVDHGSSPDNNTFGLFILPRNNQFGPTDVLGDNGYRYTSVVTQTNNTGNSPNTPTEYQIKIIVNERDPILTSDRQFDFEIRDSGNSIYIHGLNQNVDNKLPDDFDKPIDRDSDYQTRHRFECNGNAGLKIDELNRISPINNGVVTAQNIEWRIKMSQVVFGLEANDFCIRGTPAVARNVSINILTDDDNPDRGREDPFYRIIRATGYDEYDGDLTLVLKRDHGITDPLGNSPHVVSGTGASQVLTPEVPLTNVPNPCDPDNANPITSQLLPTANAEQQTYTMQTIPPRITRIIREPDGTEGSLLNVQEVKWRIVFSEPILNFTHNQLKVPSVVESRITISNEDDTTQEHDYVVTVNTPAAEPYFGGLNGSLELKFLSNNIVNQNGLPLDTTLPTGNNYQRYTITTTPRPVEITRRNPTTQNGRVTTDTDTLQWNVKFSEPIVVSSFTGNSLSVKLEPARQEVLNQTRINVSVDPDIPATGGFAEDFVVTVTGYRGKGYDGNISFVFNDNTTIQGSRNGELGLAENGASLSADARFTVVEAPQVVAVTRGEPTTENAINVANITWNIQFNEPINILPNHIRVVQDDGTDTELLNITNIGAPLTNNVYPIIVTPRGSYEGSVKITLRDTTAQNSIINIPIRDNGGRALSNLIPVDAPKFNISSSPRIVTVEQITREILGDDTSPITGNVVLPLSTDAGGTNIPPTNLKWRVLFSEPIDLTNEELAQAFSVVTNPEISTGTSIVVEPDTSTTDPTIDDYIVTFTSPYNHNYTGEAVLTISGSPVIVDFTPTTPNSLVGGFPSSIPTIYNVIPSLFGTYAHRDQIRLLMLEIETSWNGDLSSVERCRISMKQTSKFTLKILSHSMRGVQLFQQMEQSKLDHHQTLGGML